jgi:hypothetical protein
VRVRSSLFACAAGLAVFAAAGAALAQGPASAADPGAAPGAASPAAPAGAPPTAKAVAPQDLTGQWVSVVTEDWRWRMVTPAKGDFASVPLTPAARNAAYPWDIAADDAAGVQCRAFGAGGIMRIPLRIRIAWADDNTLKLETDAGQQTRLFRFVAPLPGAQLPALTQSGPPAGERTWQGETKAQWFKQPQSRGLGFGGPPPTGGVLRSVTRNMRAGYLRKNGVPYSENAVVTEQFNRHDEPNGDVWITVTTIVEDPQNLAQPFITSSHFKKEADLSKWDPAPCRTPAPLGAPIPPPAPRKAPATPVR